MTTLLDEAQSQFFLSLYRCAVRFYQPKIEERTQISLGRIEVWDFPQVDQHMMRNLERRFPRWFLACFPGFLPKARLREIADYLKSTYTDRVQGCMACYYDSAIYVSFQIDFRCHEEFIACAVVHELSHALWERLARRPLHKEHPRTPAERQKFQLLVEGYATYAEQIWFLELYPQCVRDSLAHLPRDSQSVHYRGMQRIQELVNKSGPAVLLQIPARWRSF